jgi:hypothetical protein
MLTEQRVRVVHLGRRERKRFTGSIHGDDTGGIPTWRVTGGGCGSALRMGNDPDRCCTATLTLFDLRAGRAFPRSYGMRLKSGAGASHRSPVPAGLRPGNCAPSGTVTGATGLARARAHHGSTLRPAQTLISLSFPPPSRPSRTRASLSAPAGACHGAWTCTAASRASSGIQRLT